MAGEGRSAGHELRPTFGTPQAWSVSGLYVDNDLSAYSGKIRPEYRRLLDDLRSGVADAVIAWYTDRVGLEYRILVLICDFTVLDRSCCDVVLVGESAEDRSAAHVVVGEVDH